MQAIADASSLIVLAKLDVLWLLTRLYPAVALTNAVELETVVQGKARGYADASRIEAAIHAGQLTIITPTAAERRIAATWQRDAPSLSRADCLTLACAKERGLVLVMEEQRGRNLAAAQRITDVTIQVLPLLGYIRQQLSFTECMDLLRRIGQAMRTDQAILAVLHAAATEIQHLRSGSSAGKEGTDDEKPITPD